MSWFGRQASAHDISGGGNNRKLIDADDEGTLSGTGPSFFPEGESATLSTRLSWGWRPHVCPQENEPWIKGIEECGAYTCFLGDGGLEATVTSTLRESPGRLSAFSGMVTPCKKCLVAPLSVFGVADTQRRKIEDECMRIATVVFLVCGVSLSASTSASTQEAFAGKPSSRTERERLAKKACLTGDPVKGVTLLAELYLDTNDVTYLFNQGRCFEQNRRYEDAVARFREYLIKGGAKLSEDDKALAQKHIDACESYLVRTEPRPVPTPEPVVAPPIIQPTAAGGPSVGFHGSRVLGDCG